MWHRKDGGRAGRERTGGGRERLAGERVVGERGGERVARPALFRTGVYTYIHLFGT